MPVFVPSLLLCCRSWITGGYTPLTRGLLDVCFLGNLLALDSEIIELDMAVSFQGALLTVEDMVLLFKMEMLR